MVIMYNNKSNIIEHMLEHKKMTLLSTRPWPKKALSCCVSSSTALVTSQEPRLGWLPTTRTVSPNFTPLALHVEIPRPSNLRDIQYT